MSTRMRLLPLIITTVIFLSGCQEASFKLSAESRLPKWFDLPEGLHRDDVTVRMTTYIVPTEKSVFIFKDKNGKTISKITAHRKGGYLYPKKLASPPEGFPKGYPSYEVLVSSNVTDIIEHRKMEPVFYLTSDDAVWKELDQ